MNATVKAISFAALLFVFQTLAVRSWAGTIREADYPNRYEVMETDQTGTLVDKSCTMTLRDPEKKDVTLNVRRRSYGACHPLDNGKVYRGRLNEKKNEIELVIPVGQDKARIENWQIVGVVQSTPDRP